MDTPEKNIIANPISNFEDSPVFSYLNSLSPIKLVKSIPTTQTFNSLSFASPPSVFTSPCIGSHKETRFFKRNNFTDLSKPEFADFGTEGIPDVVQRSELCTEQVGCLSPGNPTRDNTLESYNEHSDFSLDFPKQLKYGCGSHDNFTLSHTAMETDTDNITVNCDVIQPDTAHEMSGTPASLVQIERDCSLQSDTELGKNFQVEQSEEAAGCEWENFSDAADLLLFDLTILQERSEGQNHISIDVETANCISTILQHSLDATNDVQRTEYADPASLHEQHDMEVQGTQSGRVVKLRKTDQAPEILSSTLLEEQITSDEIVEVDGNSIAEVDKREGKCIHSNDKPVLKQQRSIRRLVFEMSGVHKKRSIYDNNCGSSNSTQSECDAVINKKQMVSIKPENGNSSSMLPGIGLHLNALASASSTVSHFKSDRLASDKQLSTPSSSSFDPLVSGQKLLNINPIGNPVERDSGSRDNEIQVMEDASFSFGVGEELNQRSPDKKKRRSGHGRESDFCKRCNCKKSKCLKLYCECFAAGLYCVEPCSCHGCLNKPIHEDTVLETRKQIESRNPLAFAPKVVRSSVSVPESRDDSNNTPASARHKRGCNCKKSSCQKKYCECFQGGVGCSISCRCEGCKNVFGRKDGTEEMELEGEETESHERNALETSSQNNAVEEGHLDHIPPITASHETARSLVQLPFSFSHKPLQSSFIATGESPPLCTSKNHENPDSFSHLSNSGKRLQMIPEDETPEILKGNCSPSRGVISASPNRKRVSPPHRKLGSSPGWRSGRKLILRSIPSFPSLLPHNGNTESSGKPS